MLVLPAQSLLPVGAECVGLLAPEAAARRRLLEQIGAAPNHSDAIVLGRDDPLFHGLDVAGNIDFALATRLRDRRERRRQTASLLALAGLEPLAGCHPDALDAEQAAACLLIRAVGSLHRVLLLDDPFGGLDDVPRARLHALLRRLVMVRGIGVVLASAGRDEVLAASDRVGVMAENGTIARLATVPELFAAPDSALEAAALTGANVLVGSVEALDPDDDREAAVRLGCGRVMPARRHEGVGVGELCLLAVRPDHIAFAAIDADALGGAALPVTLLEQRDGGEQLLLRLRLADGAVLNVRRPAGTIGPRDLARAAEPNGASVAWRVAQATAFPHPEA